MFVSRRPWLNTDVLTINFQGMHYSQLGHTEGRHHGTKEGLVLYKH
jgi:hypothetical protein